MEAQRGVSDGLEEVPFSWRGLEVVTLRQQIGDRIVDHVLREHRSAETTGDVDRLLAILRIEREQIVLRDGGAVHGEPGRLALPRLVATDHLVRPPST